MRSRCFIGTVLVGVSIGIGLGAGTGALAKPPAASASKSQPASKSKPKAKAKPTPKPKPAESAEAGKTKPKPATAPAKANANKKLAAKATKAPVVPKAKLSPHEVELRAFEERVNALKEKVFRSKARLVQLQEAILHGTVSGAQLVLRHRNEMGDSFRIKSVLYVLDGSTVYQASGPPQTRAEPSDSWSQSAKGSARRSSKQAGSDDVEVFRGHVAPGPHEVTVTLEYCGHGYGVFSYLKDYTFKVTATHAFEAAPKELTTVTGVGYEKGGVTTELSERPAIRYELDVSPGEQRRTGGRPNVDAAR